MKVLDFVLLAVSVGLTGYSGWVAWSGATSGGPPMVEIQGTGGIDLYPLSENRDITVKGPAGVTLLRIQSGEVYAVSSPGPLHIILQMGKIHKAGDWLASMPNHVFVRIRGGAPADIDASVY